MHRRGEQHGQPAHSRDAAAQRETHGEVVGWVAELPERGLSPSRITKVLLCLKQVLALAVMDGRLARNAAEHV